MHCDFMISQNKQKHKNISVNTIIQAHSRFIICVNKRYFNCNALHVCFFSRENLISANRLNKLNHIRTNQLSKTVLQFLAKTKTQEDMDKRNFRSCFFSPIQCRFRSSSSLHTIDITALKKLKY